uniref:Rap associating with DIL domain n=1 Tax=Apteryx owenii TaxID=8824 RepID=A0A8B9QC65_APTOW
ESLFSSTITASEEAMTVLEEVIMYTFQQCVYYISKCLYASLPALLECNPFQNEGRETWRTSPALPEELRRVVLIYQDVLDLLRQYEVHPEITSQMFAYLFFFSNTLLFNQLLDKGSSLGCFHWSKGVKLRACVRLLLEWLRGAGFEQPAQQFFAKLASVADLLAVPGSQLLQVNKRHLGTVSWSSPSSSPRPSQGHPVSCLVQSTSEVLAADMPTGDDGQHRLPFEGQSYKSQKQLYDLLPTEMVSAELRWQLHRAAGWSPAHRASWRLCLISSVCAFSNIDGINLT